MFTKYSKIEMLFINIGIFSTAQKENTLNAQNKVKIIKLFWFNSLLERSSTVPKNRVLCLNWLMHTYKTCTFIQTVHKKTFIQFYLTSAIVIIVFGEEMTSTHEAVEEVPAEFQ